MNQSSKTGPSRLMNRSTIGNGLWWLARRHMSAQRLANNHQAIQRRISKLTPTSHVDGLWPQIGVTLCLFMLIAVNSGSSIFLPLYPKPSHNLDGIGVQPPKSPLEFKYMTIRARPKAYIPKRQPSPVRAEPPTQTNTLEILSIKPTSPTTSERTSRTKLSALLHQFSLAQKAQDAGYLNEAKTLFLAIARSGDHPALGQESYLRVLEIARMQNDKLAHQELVREAISRWPSIKLQPKH